MPILIFSPVQIIITHPLDILINLFKHLLKHDAFLTCSWRFLRSNKLEQSKFQLEKIIGILKHIFFFDSAVSFFILVCSNP